MSCCRMEETLLNAYGADGHRGSGQERIKLQSEMDRAHKQVYPSYLKDEQQVTWLAQQPLAGHTGNLIKTQA